MPYIKTFDRTQMMFCSWDSFVDEQSIARIIDAFVNSLNLLDYGVKEAAVEGRPSYDPKGLYKLYIYGSRKGIRSSRKLQESCEVNIEVKWMLGGVEPDFRTIVGFRKDNIDSLRKIFHEFNRCISGAVGWGFASVDASKFHACNSRDNNFTKNKLDDRIKWLNAHTDEYLRILNEMDERENQDEEELLTRENIEAKLKEARERLARYGSYQKQMEETGVSQLSLTDGDAKLMKNRNGFAVSYNPQTAVDSNTHLIHDFQMTNQVTDHGLLYSTLENIKAENPDGIIESVADKGYENEEDMVKCLENGIIPHVIPDDGKDGYELETDYVESEVNLDSTKPEELSRTLHAGQIPKAYEKVIEKMEVREVRYFVRDAERNLVYCLAGEILRQKCIKKNGNIRYANKNACRHCKNRDKCYKGKNEWKEIDFTKDKLEKPCKDWLKAEGNEVKTEKVKRKGHYETKKVVRFFLKPDREKTERRMCLPEHPFGTIKRTMGSSYFLLKGMRKVAGEFSLFCLGYNIERARNLLGFKKMMQLMAGA